MTMESDLVALQGNDETYNFEIFYGPTVLDLTDLVPTFYLKATRVTSDLLAWTVTPTVTSAFLGMMTVTIPRAQLTAAGTLWYRIDVVNQSAFINTVVFGIITVLAV